MRWHGKCQGRPREGAPNCYVETGEMPARTSHIDRVTDMHDLGMGVRVVARTCGHKLAGNNRKVQPDMTTKDLLYGALADRIENREIAVGVIGLGYVGLPLAHGLVAADVAVVGFDVDPQKVEALGAGESYMEHLADETFTVLADSGLFEATVDMGRLSECDVVIVCVPTPLGAHQEPDLTYVFAAASDIGEALRPGQLIILESTTYPGTTRDEFLPAILSASSGAELVLGEEVFVAYSPEREDPGRKEDSTSIPKLVGGLDDRSRELALAVYGHSYQSVVPVASAEIAEAAKLLENIFRSVNIALVNEMKMVLGAMGIDVWDVVEAASTKPFGFMPFYPGPGLGGHCIPIDPFYLTWKAKEVGRPVQFIEVAGIINTEMPNYVVDQLAAGLNEQLKPINGSKILIVGLAYKADVSDTRESPSFELIDLISKRGGVVSYTDPFIPKTYPVRRHDIDLMSADLTPESLRGVDAVVISTAHSSIDYAMIAEHAPLVVDTRNVMAPFADEMGDRLVKA